jgi:hypothetical protein
MEAKQYFQANPRADFFFSVNFDKEMKPGYSQGVDLADDGSATTTALPEDVVKFASAEGATLRVYHRGKLAYLMPYNFEPKTECPIAKIENRRVDPSFMSMPKGTYGCEIVNVPKGAKNVKLLSGKVAAACDTFAKLAPKTAEADTKLDRRDQQALIEAAASFGPPAPAVNLKLEKPVMEDAQILNSPEKSNSKKKESTNGG